MLSKDYSHYNKLTKQDLISMIEKRDIEIKKNQEKLKEVNKLKMNIIIIIDFIWRKLLV